MTATQPAAPVCPECGGRNTMILSDGMARCFDGPHEWNPDEVAALPRPPTVAEVDDQFAGELEQFTADTAAETEHLRDELVGGTARLEGGQVAVVLNFPDDDHVMVRTNDGRDELVSLSDVERITPRAPEYVIDPEAADDEPAAEWISDVAALSDLILKAGLATIYETDVGPSVGQPPADWLPRDASSNALVEAAAAVAVARLVIAYEIDVDDILEGLGGPPAETDMGDHAQEETNDVATDTDQ